METNGGNQASTQTRESSLPTGEIVVVREPTINPISTEVAMDQNPSSDLESQTDDCDPCLQTSSYYFKVAIILVCFYLGVGVVCFYLVRHQFDGDKTNGVLDAFYFTVILMTSVGYGELTPNSTLSLLFAILFAMVGILLTGAMWSLIAEMFLAPRRKIVLDASKTNKEKVESSTMTIKKCSVKVMAVWLVVFLAIGIVVLVTLEDLKFIDAFYCINATLISVGCDKCFLTKGGRVFALFWMLQGMGLISCILFTFMELCVQKRQSWLVKKILGRTMTLADLVPADLDGDGDILLAEYILFMLNEMEKVTRKDVEPIIEEYQACRHDEGVLRSLQLSLSLRLN
ncbi:hypothetical protein OSB04_004146 [Centaurea solstitialis]|uniref:Potassium channel domain-containing protein n=1 Tax=Centaurea solstitialis TaxID=347529 RepID=A0AA38U7Y4_9ASTR|nr:hypothetical protein OSB04_004146 [Centaurea solstitialis]